jgi:hypothetical protein
VHTADPWFKVSQRAIPSFLPDSLAPAGLSPIRFDYTWPGPLRKALEGLGDRRLDVYSPDSSRFVNFDMYADVSRDESGKIVLEGDVDSAPILADFKSDTLWRVSFCGTCCSFDGAYWMDSSRFLLTGLTQDCVRGVDLRVFLDLYDLRSHMVHRWLGPKLGESEIHLYRAATDSALNARFSRRGR